MKPVLSIAAFLLFLLCSVASAGSDGTLNSFNCRHLSDFKPEHQFTVEIESALTDVTTFFTKINMTSILIPERIQAFT
ncbi:MAG: hypothetical protein ABL927_12040, partial [Bdellovibrionales bacterium]